MLTSVPSDAALPLESRRQGARSGLRPRAAAARPVPDREMARAPRGRGCAGRRRDLDPAALRRGGGGDHARLRAAAGAAGDGDHDRHPLRDALEPLRRRLPRRPLAGASRALPAEAVGALRYCARGGRLHRERAARRARRGERTRRVRGGRRAADSRARRAGTSRRPVPLLLEEREVAERHRARAVRPARLLGALRLPQRRRPLERGEVRVLMGGITVHEFMTLDGIVDAPTWTFDFGFDPKMGETIKALTDRSRAILLGRTTYEMFEPAWSSRTEEDDPGAPFFNDTQKYVVSSTLTEATWRNSTILGPYDPEAIRHLKADTDGDVYVSGSGTLVRALLADGLLDELHLFVFPLTRGSGARLFTESMEPLNLSLTACEGYANGAIHLGYAPSPQTG